MLRFESFRPKILKFLAVAGVEKEDSGASMFPPSAIFEIFSSNVFGDMECIFPVGIRWTGLFLVQDPDLFQRNSEEKQWETVNISK